MYFSALSVVLLMFFAIASSSEIAENIAQEMGVTVVGELQDIISLYDDLYEIFDKDERVLH